ncbi:MAG: hypothetical protein JKX70_09660 [Phycisphaerales bacterium]|nr:hypothetical protein [Phycisphaerales bacterium]
MSKVKKRYIALGLLVLGIGGLFLDYKYGCSSRYITPNTFRDSRKIEHMIKCLESGKLDPNAKVDYHKWGMLSLLMAASRSGELKLVQVLIQAGADVNERDQFGQGALAQAVVYMGSNFEIGIALMENGADPNVIPLNGNTVINSMVRHADPEWLQRYIDSGMDAISDDGYAIRMAAFKDIPLSLDVLLNSLKPEEAREFAREIRQSPWYKRDQLTERVIVILRKFE